MRGDYVFFSRGAGKVSCGHLRCHVSLDGELLSAIDLMEPIHGHRDCFRPLDVACWVKLPSILGAGIWKIADVGITVLPPAKVAWECGCGKLAIQ